MANADGYYPIVGIHDGLDPDKHQLLRKVHLRMEIDEWYKSQQLIHVNQRALFFPAFLEFSRKPPKEKLSYFQIAGIHGKPFIAWDEPLQKGFTEGEGYCTHNSILFSTWHRPYLLLFEQIISDLMKKEANKYSESERPDLLEAAETWRLPYWDWALKKQLPESPGEQDYNVPLVVLEKKVHIRQPTILGHGFCENAFYQFTMPKDLTMGDSSLGKDENPLEDLRIHSETWRENNAIHTLPFDICKATSRHAVGKGDNRDWVDGKQDNAAVAKILRDYKWDPITNTDANDRPHGNLTANLRDAFYRVLTIQTFEDFGTKRAPGRGAFNGPKSLKRSHAFDSAESLHDSMHIWCGGPMSKPDENNIHFVGHMSNVPVAAFDPIFWIHHCNVDRLIALWQILHDNSWFDGTDPRDEDLGTFAIQRGNRDRPQDILRPFHKNSHGDYWTSVDAREVTALGYTYPGLEKWRYTKPDGTYDKERHVQETIRPFNTKYNSAWSAAEKAELTADPGQLDGVSLMSLNSLQEVTKREPIDLTINDYVVNVIYEKFALNGISFTIHIFIGDVPSQLPYTFQESGTQVGQVVNFSTEPNSIGASPDGCPNCRRQAEDHAESTGRVILTNALITRWKNQIPYPRDDGSAQTLASMEPADVVEFLKSNMHWRVTSMGELVDFDRIPSLKVSVAAGKADHYADRSKLSRFYDYKGAYAVTEGRPGGAGPEDQLYPPGYHL